MKPLCVELPEEQLRTKTVGSLSMQMTKNGMNIAWPQNTAMV